MSSALPRTEVSRSLLASGEDAVAAGRAVLARYDLVRVNDRVLDLARTMGPAELRSLDAIHLATAERLCDEISELVVYDQRMADAARRLGHRVSSPKWSTGDAGTPMVKTST